MQKMKEFFLLMTIGHLGLHHVALGNWKKSLPLLVSFMVAMFAFTGNLFFLKQISQGNEDLPLAEIMLHPDSFFTWIFMAGFIINRLLWMWEIILYLKSALKRNS
jgi:hypothetical protein